jgi:putative ABC transport system permease protein
VRLVVTRLWSHPGLSALALLGIVLSVGLVTNASFFAQAVDQVILNQELREFSRMTNRPAFSTSIYTFPSGRAPVSLQEAEELAEHVADTLASEVGLPRDHLGIEVHSGNLMLQPPEESQYAEGEEDAFLSSVDVVYIADVAEHMEIIAGEPLDEGASDGVLDVWIHQRLAEKMGINVGEEFNIGINVRAEKVPLQIQGIWQAEDPDARFWFGNPDATLQNTLLVRRLDYINYIQPLVPSKTWYLSWHVILDDSQVYPELAQEYLAGFNRASQVINKYLPGAKINTPPLDPLASFVQRGDTLTILLLGFNIPALGFLLYFLALTSAIIARWQQRETATMVSRGVRASNIMFLTIIEELVIFLLGYPLGVGFGMFMARMMGYTDSFLSFSLSRSPLPVSLRGINVQLVIVSFIVALLSRLIPTLKATRHSTVEVERELSRPQTPPFWYRSYLDFLLILPTAYAYRQLVQRGTIALLAQNRPEDIYQDPLLILVPTLFIMTGALVTLRIFPLIMRILDVLAGLVRWSTPHLALRQLSRQSHAYINPLLLVIVSLALGVYTLSMAASLDNWLVDRMYYRTGSDLSFGVMPLSYEQSGVIPDDLTGEWIPLPYEFAALSGVEAGTRVGDYRMSTKLIESGDVRGRFLAIDRLAFPQVAWFRGDFADESLGGLMNRLAISADSILVSQEVMEQNHLLIGDKIPVRIGINYAINIASEFTIAGTYEYFPTVYEEDDITFVGNLDHLSFILGLTVPHNIWLDLEDGADMDLVHDQIESLGVSTIFPRNAPMSIQLEQSKLERVGVFGTLSVGFLAAVVMAVMALLIYTYASLQERLHRFTILRAVGLQRRQIMGQVVLEYAFLTGYGTLMGAFIGMTASNLFVPLFRVTGEEGVPLPPLIPLIAQDKVMYLIAVFVGLIVLMEVVVVLNALSKRAFSMLRGVWG